MPAITADSAPTNGTCHRAEVDLQLFYDTQAYLLSLAAGQAPSPLFCGAWKRFYRMHAPLVKHVVRAYRLAPEDAEDCVQEVWAEIVDRLPQLRYEPQRGRFRCWIFVLIRNKVIDFVRGVARASTSTVADLERFLLCRELDPAAAYEQARKRRLICHALADLQRRISSTNCRLLRLRWIEGRSVEEVAARLDLTRKQVYYRDHRVRKKLRRLLEIHGLRNEEVDWAG